MAGLQHSRCSVVLFNGGRRTRRSWEEDFDEKMYVCLQAQSAAAAAEASTLEASKYARMSHCIKALTAAQAAAQSFNLVCLFSLPSTTALV